MALVYLLKTKTDFQGINTFYVLGSMAEVLSLQYLEPNAIFSMSEEQSPISYNLSLFEFFAHYSLRNPQNQNLCKFAFESLDFLKIEEIR